jgi:SPP1 gp7 family putative phage head morphogenesis protein
MPLRAQEKQMPKIERKASEVPSALRTIDVKAVLRRRGMYLRLRRNQELKEAAKPLAKEFMKKKNGKSKTKEVIDVVPQKYISFSDEVVAAYAAKTIHNVATLEQHLELAINKFLVNTLLAKALENLPNLVNASKGSKDIKTKKVGLFDEEDKAYLINQAKIELSGYLLNMAVLGGQDANQLIGVEDPYIPSEALKRRIEGNVTKFATSMVDTDQDHLSNLIVEGIDDGKGVPEIASAIKSDFDDYSTMQATRITRTEIIRSANQSAVDAYKQSGVVEGKQWVIYGAEDECAEYDGEVVNLDNGFYSGSNEFQDGDPPLHPNCKCVVIPVVSNSDESS